VGERSTIGGSAQSKRPRRERREPYPKQRMKVLHPCHQRLLHRRTRRNPLRHLSLFRHRYLLRRRRIRRYLLRHPNLPQNPLRRLRNMRRNQSSSLLQPWCRRTTERSDHTPTPSETGAERVIRRTSPKKFQKSRLADARALATRYTINFSPAGSGFSKAQLHATLLLPLPRTMSAGRPYSTGGR
jgi:hypothetical protein